MSLFPLKSSLVEVESVNRIYVCSPAPASDLLSVCLTLVGWLWIVAWFIPSPACDIYRVKPSQPVFLPNTRFPHVAHCLGGGGVKNSGWSGV